MCREEDLTLVEEEHWEEFLDEEGNTERKFRPSLYRCRQCGRKAPLNLLLSPTCEDSAYARLETEYPEEEARRQAVLQEAWQTQRRRRWAYVSLAGFIVLPLLFIFGKWYLFDKQQSFAGKTTSQWLEYVRPVSDFEQSYLRAGRLQEAERAVQPDPAALDELLDAQLDRECRQLSHKLLDKFTAEQLRRRRGLLLDGLHHSDRNVRTWCLRLSGRLGPYGDSLLEPLEQILRDEQEPIGMRRQAAAALAELITEENSESWLETLHSEDAADREAALLVWLNWPQAALSQLLEDLADERADVRKTAADGLRQIGNPATEAILAGLGDPERRPAMVAIVDELRNPPLAELSRALETGPLEQQIGAALALAELSDAGRRYLPQLQRLAAAETTDARLQEACRQAMEKLQAEP